MVETQKEREERLRREAASKETRTGESSFVPVETLPEEKTPTKEADWEKIKHPGTIPSTGDPYGTRPTSELTPPPVVTDKADLAAVRMMDKEKAERERMERERIMAEATPEAAAARAAMASKEGSMTQSEADKQRARAAATGAAVGAGAAATQMETEAERERRMKTGAAMTGAAVAAGAAASRTSPEAAERTTRAGAAIETPPTRPVATERPVTGTVVPPGTERVTPMKPYGTVDERARMHAEDPSVHPDWETQPQINAPMDVGIPTAEGQADAARIRAGRRRSDESKEPRLERRGDEISTPAASSARAGGVTGAVKETARDVKEKTKETARDVKEDVDRKI